MRRSILGRIILAAVAAVALTGVLAWIASASTRGEGLAAPLYGIELPRDYRDWRLVSVAREEGTLDDIRAVLGNDVAIRAYRAENRPFPDGTVIARLAWSYVPSEQNDRAFGRQQSFVAGLPKNGVQFMVKNARKYAASGGWGYGHFDDGKPADEAMHRTCAPCHEVARASDYVFTHYSR